jgi:uncharacterized protein (DUF1501 family)
MRSRRAFLKSALRGSSLIALAPTVPGFLVPAARAAAAGPDRAGRVLVVIQLDGGNDGINMVVPFADEGYARHRRVLRLPSNDLIKLDGALGFHPGMREAARLLQSGRLAIVPGVGYPNTDRSHFRSMAIWHTARLDPEGHDESGWLGRGIDAAGQGRSSAVFVGSGSPPRATQGRRSIASTVEQLEDLLLDPEIEPARALASAQPGDGLLTFVRRSMLDAYTSADRLAEAARIKDAGARYPATALGQRLRLAARLLKGDFAARILYTCQSGYDTHAYQLSTHFDLISELSGALRAFLDDLAAAKLAERVLVVCFSEFGRRVAENGSAGTDHGTAGLVLLAGPSVRTGVVGHYPSLTDLADGDLKWLVDFRQIYATLLDEWLGLDSHVVLGGSFVRLPVLRS